MDISKLVDLLSTRTVFFSRADRFNDPWEGTVSQSDFDDFKQTVADLPDRETLITNYPRMFQGFRRHTYISCWHENSGESYAMWKLYLKSNEGIAVQTTFGRLKCELNKATSRDIFIGKIEYRDPKKESIPGGRPYQVGDSYVVGGFAPFTRKRLGFSHEQEVRALFRDDASNVIEDQPEDDHGLRIPVSIEDLVQDVYVAPGTPKWLRDAIQSVLAKFGVDGIVRQSELDEPPAC